MRELDEMETSALLEVGNIGSGHAAATLAEIVGRRVDVNVPKVWVARPPHFPSGFGAKTSMIATHFKVLGEPSGGILFTLTQTNAQKLLDLVIHSQGGFGAEWGEMEESNLKETGLILCASYLNALNQLMRLRLIPSIPKILYGETEKVFFQAFGGLPSPLESSIGVLNQFVELSTGLEAFFFFIPDPSGLQMILERLGVTVSDERID